MKAKARPDKLVPGFSLSVPGTSRGAMGSSSKTGKGKKPELSDQILILRQRLRDALALGIKFHDNKVRKWQCMDAEIQSHAVRTMTAFIGCLSVTLLQNPLIKESILEMLVALEGILQSKSERVLCLAVDVTLRLVSVLGNTIRQYPMLEVISSLTNSLSLCQLPSAISCAIALNRILANLGLMRGKSHNEVWKALEKTNAVGIVVCALQEYADGVQPLEYFIEMTSLLKTILWRWPLSRYHVWSNTRLMAQLEDKCLSTNNSVAIAVLKLYSALALCGNGAMKLLESKELIFKIVQTIGKPHPYSVRIEALILCQNLMRSIRGCSLLIGFYCEPIVQGIIDAMGRQRSLSSKRVPADQMPVVMEACRAAALITRWAGVHHSCFWNHKIDIILLNILGNYSITCQTQKTFSSEELLATIYDNVTDTRPYVWDILGYLAAHCEEDLLPETDGKNCYLDVLITCACSVAIDLMKKGFGSLASHTSELEPVFRAVLLMVFSSCKYIASKARNCLLEMLKTSGEVCLVYALTSLELNATGDVPLLSYSFHTMINLISLACYSTLPHYRELIVKRKGIKILSAIIKMCLDSDIHVNRMNFASHLRSSSDGKPCCWSHVEEWEGEDILLFYSLHALSQLMGLSTFLCSHHKITSGKIVVCTMCGHSEAEDLINSLWHILNNSFGSGPRWYAAYILSFFSLYGFPSKLGRKMERALDEDEFVDLKLLLTKGKSLRAHTAVIVARCPYLLPPKESFMKKTWDDESNEDQELDRHERSLHEVRLSDRVDSVALTKILIYVYTGFIQVDDDLVKPLKILAKGCRLKSLSAMLHQKLPKWGTATPSCDYTAALEPAGHLFFDIILESKTTEVVGWHCDTCQLSMPHKHAHKVILCSSSDYLRALFQSGMHDSNSQIIKVPVGWDALAKLISWFYSGDLPSVVHDCTWNNLNLEQQIHELQAYVELSSLAEYWCLEEVGEKSLKVIFSSLASGQKYAAELIRFAASLNQWKIVEVGVSTLAPLYPRLRDAGELEDLHEQVVDMLRAEYVRYSQRVMIETEDESLA